MNKDKLTVNKETLTCLINKSIEKSNDYIRLLEEIEANPSLIFDAFSDKNDYRILTKLLYESENLLNKRIHIKDLQNYIISILKDYLEFRINNIRVENSKYNGFPPLILIKNINGDNLIKVSIRKKEFCRDFNSNISWIDSELNYLKEKIEHKEKEIKEYSEFLKNPIKGVKSLRDLYYVLFKNKIIIDKVNRVIEKIKEKIERDKKRIKELSDKRPQLIKKYERLEKEYQEIKPFFIKCELSEQDEKMYC